uniref:RNase H type-1 domain-containing protein n=1 Tax=Fagus sylvatica TaxID=28930 RepID=A0A2N9GKZ6_FAGSY
MSAVLDQVPSKVTEEMNQALGKEFTTMEVGVALVQMGPIKALGPDGHQIVDNIMVAFEAMHSLNSFKGRARWIELVMNCIMSISYSVMVNGEPNGMIYPLRGLRLKIQGTYMEWHVLEVVCVELQGIIHQFWWGQSRGVNKVNWLAWKKMCVSKFKGGMGFGDLAAFNLALLAKPGWRLIHESQSLFAKVFKAKYFPNCSFVQAKVKSGCFYIWRSIATARSVLEQGSKWRVGNGECILIRKDRWVPNQANGLIPYPIDGLQQGGSDVASILQYPLLPSLPKDALIWWGTPSDSSCGVLEFVECFETRLCLEMWLKSLRRDRIVWSAPLEGWYKVNMDGAVFANLRKVGVGVVIHNKRGEFLGAMCELLDFGLDVTDAEALAALRAIEFATEVCPFSMLFEGDCLQVIRALYSPEYDASRVGHKYSLARSKLSLFRDFFVAHVLREGNSVAHRLAKFARNVTGSQVWLEHVPSFLGLVFSF